MRNLFESAKYKTVKLQRADLSYFDMTLTERKFLLNAPSEHHFCKTIVLENKNFKQKFQNYRYYPQYVCVLIQFVTRLSSGKLGKQLKSLQNNFAKTQNNIEQIGITQYHFRLTKDETFQNISGYQNNGATPFNFIQKIPIIISDKIQELNPSVFWCGGGHPEIKLRITLKEFLEKSDFSEVIFADISQDPDEEQQ